MTTVNGPAPASAALSALADDGHRPARLLIDERAAGEQRT
jgi:hypothetical protein